MATLTLSFWLPHGVSAQNRSASGEIEFSIPAQPLDSALEEYMRVTGLQILYKSALTVSRVSGSMVGPASAKDALDRLLSGTSLSARHTADGAFTIDSLSVSSEVVDKSHRRRLIAEYDNFLGMVQSRIVESLCQNMITLPGSYRVALQFSIQSSGVLESASLLGSTGDVMRDHLIAAAVQGIGIGEPPPANMPQPVTLLIAPHQAASGNECSHLRRENSRHGGAAPSRTLTTIGLNGALGGESWLN